MPSMQFYVLHPFHTQRDTLNVKDRKKISKFTPLLRKVVNTSK